MFLTITLLSIKSVLKRVFFSFEIAFLATVCHTPQYPVHLISRKFKIHLTSCSLTCIVMFSSFVDGMFKLRKGCLNKDLTSLIGLELSANWYQRVHT